MKYSKTRPGEVITSPIYAGSREMVARMQECEPHEFTKHLPWEAFPGKRGVGMRLEYCVKCRCVRTRIKGPQETIEENFPDGGEV